MASNNNGLTSLRLLDYSDRELLLIVMDISRTEQDSYASTVQIADALGIQGKRRKNSVGVRLAALKRMGVIEKKPEGSESRWAVSAIGQMMANGQLTKAIKERVENLPPGQLLMLTRELTRHYRTAPAGAEHLIRREWVYGTARR